MSHSRNMKYLNDRRIIYRRLPVNDQPSEVFEWGWFYENGTHEYYNLFNSPAMINTYKSLLWHLIVLFYLNEGISQAKFERLAYFITDKKNGFVTFNASKSMVSNMLSEVYDFDFNLAPKNKIKKIIFKDFIPLNKNEKLSIVGKLLGRTSKATPENIYQCMVELNELGEKITISKLAKHLNCTTRTVYRNLTDELKQEKDNLNEEVQCTKLRTPQKRFRTRTDLQRSV